MLRHALAAAALLAASTAQADQFGAINATGKSLYPIALPAPADGDAATGKMLAEVESFDLSVSSWFKVVDPRSFLADLKTEALSIEPDKWKAVGAFGVVKANATVNGDLVTLTFKLYEVDKGAVPVLEKQYVGHVAEARHLVHKWCNDVVTYYTKEPGFFGSQLTFAGDGRNGSAIYVMDFDGQGLGKATRNDSVNILPAFAPGGGQVAFTSYMRGNPDLYMTSTGGGRARRVASYPGMNTGASFSPDGTKIAVTLSKDGSPDIYILSAKDGSILNRLTNNRYIDTSPAFSPDGSEIAFVSNRTGSPQIWVMSADGSNQRQVSTVGNYNQTPAWSPRKGVRILAYTAQDDASGAFDIVTLDLDKNQLTRITQGQGRNEEPTWSPNGRVLAFTSSRPGGTGIYLANADGTGEQKIVAHGSFTSPDWGPVLP